MISVENVLNNNKLMNEIYSHIPYSAKQYLDKDEIESEVNFIIFESIKKYDSKKSSLKTYLVICIKNRFQRIILAAKKRRSTFESVDLSAYLVYDKSPEEEAVLNYLKTFSVKTLNHMHDYMVGENAHMSETMAQRIDQIISTTLHLVRSNNLESF